MRLAISFLPPTLWTKQSSLRAWFIVKSGTIIPLFWLKACRRTSSSLFIQLGWGLRSWLLHADLTNIQLVLWTAAGLPTTGRRRPLTLLEKISPAAALSLAI